MEQKQRESTLEVLRRLQSKNKRSIPSMYEKSPVKLKVEDIIDVPKSHDKIRIKGRNSEVINILNQIRNIEKELKLGKSYFDHYYDLRRKEDQLLKLYESSEDKEGFPDEVLKKISEINKKFKK
jgi:hypothetical protein